MAGNRTRKVYTPEQRAEMKKVTLDKLYDGYEVSEIANPFNTSITMINNLRKELVAEGEISEETIRMKREERRRTCRRIGIKLSTEQREEYSRRILYMLKEEGISESEMARILEISSTTVRKIKEELIDASLITQTQIDKKRDQRKSEIGGVGFQFSNSGRERNEAIVLSQRKAEEEIGTIATQIGASKTTVCNITRQLKKKHLITQAELNQIRLRRRQRSSKEIGEAKTQATERKNKIKAQIQRMINFDAELETATIQEYIKMVKLELRSGETVPIRDLTILGDAILMDWSLMTDENINFVIQNLTKKGDEMLALSFIDKCIEATHQAEETRIRKTHRSKKADTR